MKITVQELTHISLLAGLSFIGSLIAIPVGPVPITLQTLFVLVSGLILAPRAAMLSQVLHLLLVLLLQGFQSFLTPSFGFLFGFIIAAGVMAGLKNKKQPVNDFILVLLGTFLIYLIGTPYMALILNGWMDAGLSLSQILLSGMFLFLPGDFVKALLALAVAKSLERKRIMVR